MPLGVLHQLRGAVEAHGLRIEHGRHKGLGLVALEPAAFIRDQRKAVGVAFRKAVFAEALDLIEEAFGKCPLIAVAQHAGHELVAMRLQAALFLPRRHVTAQPVGTFSGVIGRDHGQFHHLLLKDGDTQRASQRLGQTRLLTRHVVFRALVFDRQAPPRPFARLQIRVHHAAADGPGPHDGDFDHQVVERGGLQARQHAHLRAAFDLEGAHGVGAPDHLVGSRAFALNIGAAERLAAPTFDHVDAAPHGGEHAQREHIDLHQAQRFQIVLVPLDDLAQRGQRRQALRHLRHRRAGESRCTRLFMRAGFPLGIALHGGGLQRHQTVQGCFRQHEAAHMLAQMARRAAQLLGQLQPQRGQARREAGAHALCQLAQAVHGQALVEPVVILGEGVDQAFIHAQRLAHVAQGASGSVADDGGGQRGAVAAVFLVDILDDLFASLVLEIDVDVGRFILARLADETLQQRAGFLRVGSGDAETPAHHRVGGRTTPLAQDALALGEAHDVVHGEKEHFVAAFRNERQFLLDQALDVGRHTVRITLGRACVGEPAQGLGRRQTLDHRFTGVVVLDLFQRESAALRHGQRGGQQVGRNHLGQPLARAQVAFAVGVQLEAAFGHRLADADGGHHVVQALGGAHVQVHVARGGQRAAGGFLQVLQLRQPQGIVGGAIQFAQQGDF